MQKYASFWIMGLIILLNCSFALSQDTGSLTDHKSYPANFVGHDPVSVYQLFAKHKLSLQKSKFETTENFKVRVTNLLTKIRLGGTKTASDSFTFVSNGFEENYDADSNNFTVTLTSESVPSIDYEDAKLAEAFYGSGVATNGSKNTTASEVPLASGPLVKKLAGLRTAKWLTPRWFTLNLRDSTRLIGTALGQNAFGVKRRYKIKTYSSVGLALYQTNQSRYDKSLSFSVKPDAARALSGRIALAITGRLKYPFIAADNSADEATLTDPEEAHYFNYYLLFEPTAIAVYDVRTGKIYKKVELPIKTQNGSEDRLPGESLGLLSGSEDSLLSPVKSASVTSDVSILYKPKPKYTDAARSNNIMGSVLVKVTLLASGQVGSVTAVRGLPHGLTEQAIEAAKAIRFEPAMRNGVAYTTVQTLEFGFNGDETKTISGGVVNGKAIGLPKPTYPPEARAVRASGAISVQVLIDETGRVVSATAVSGHPLLRAAAVDAALRASFRPTQVDGQPARVSGVVTYNFVP